jgi:hypothetical protein
MPQQDIFVDQTGMTGPSIFNQVFIVHQVDSQVLHNVQVVIIVESSGLGTTGTLLKCVAGTYCPIGSTGPTTCPTGTYCPSIQMSAPTNCSTGNYCDRGSTQMNSCPIGYYCTSASSEEICPSGKYCQSGWIGINGTLNNCPTGSYCPNPGTSNPTLCTGGTYCPSG